MTPADPDSSPALGGMKVVDFSRLFAGPYATMTLADLGADVIKVEPPAGDEARHFGPPFLGGEGMNFMALNRHKRSITLDMKKPSAVDGRRAGSAPDADVVIENFRPGVADQLGVGYEQLLEGQPRPRLLLDQRVRPDRRRTRAGPLWTSCCRPWRA